MKPNLRTVVDDDDDAKAPGAKRPKHEPHTPAIRCVLADDLTACTPLEPVVGSTLANQADISVAMRELIARLPLPPRLQHLKRVRKDRRIIVFAQRDFVEALSAEPHGREWHASLVADWAASTPDDSPPNFLAGFEGVSEAHLGRVTRLYLRHRGIAEPVIELLCVLPVGVHSVAAQLPALRWQFDAVNASWPCKFHPNRAAEERYNNAMFTAAETAERRRNMRIALAISADADDRPAAGVAVDPRTGRIVAAATARPAATHPLMHSAMVLIDAVARSQNAGAWNDWPTGATAAGGGGASVGSDGASLCGHGVPEPLRTLFARDFPDAQIGAQPIADVGPLPPVPSDGGDNLARFGPYLCTGYDVYLTEEPCMMCAMALVHSRVRTVFYGRPMANGALGTCAKLHTVKALNHHYDVYQIAPNPESNSEL